jgi:hypothetical protein
MGIMKGHALSEENAPGFGRGMGMTTAEKPVSPMVGPTPHQMPGGHAGRGTGSGQGRVPGFPQDMWMPMDEEVTKAESYGLPKDWSASLGGMMTLVRVLPPDKFDEIMALVKETDSDAQSMAPQPRPATPPALSDGHRH